MERNFIMKTLNLFFTKLGFLVKLIGSGPLLLTLFFTTEVPAQRAQTRGVQAREAQTRGVQTRGFQAREVQTRGVQAHSIQTHRASIHVPTGRLDPKALPIYSDGLGLIPLHASTANYVKLSKHDGSGYFLFPYNVSFDWKKSSLKLFEESMRKTEEILKAISNVKLSLPTNSNQTLISRVHEDKYNPLLDTFVYETIYKKRKDYPLLANTWFAPQLLPAFMYIQSMGPITYLLENQSVKLFEPYEGKNLIEWAFLLDRVRIINWMIDKNPELLNSAKNLSSFFNKMWAQNRLEVLDWLFKQNPPSLPEDLALKLLKRALTQRDLEKANWLIEKNPKLLEKINLLAFMSKALRLGHRDIAEWFFDKKASSLKKSEILELISYFLKQKNLEIVQWLMKKNPIVLKTTDLNRFLQTALESQNFEIANWLITQEAEINQKLVIDFLSLRKSTPGKFKTLNWLLENSPENFENLNLNRFLRTALESHDFRFANWLITQKAQVSHDLANKLLKQGNLTVINWLDKNYSEAFKNLNLNRRFITALESQNFELAQWLLKKGVKINTKLALRFLEQRNVEVLDWLFNRNKQLLDFVNPQNFFNRAINTSNIALADWLWTHSQITLLDKHFDKAGSPEMASWILDQIEEPEEKPPIPEKPLAQQMLEAVAQGDIKKVKQLQQKGASVNAIYQGYNPLSKAIEIQNPWLISYFIRHEQTDINAKTVQNQLSPFMLAVQAGDLKTATELDRKGADPSLQNLAGQRALDMVEAIPNPDIRRKMTALIKKSLCKNGFL